MKRRPLLPSHVRSIYYNKLYHPFIRISIYSSIFIIIIASIVFYKIGKNISLNYSATQIAYFTATNFYVQTLTAAPSSTSTFTPTNRPTHTSTPVSTPTTIPLASSTITTKSCLGAPKPHVIIGQTVTVFVENFDKLKLRSEPRISPDTVVIDLDKYTNLIVLDGPVCVTSEENSSYWFWKVKVISNNNTGWVAEGDFSHYYID